MKELRLCLVGLSLIVVASACQSKSTRLSRGTNTNCTFEKRGKVLVIGDRECLAALPRRVIHGYLVIDHEYSVLYKSRKDVKDYYDESATWVELSEVSLKTHQGMLGGSGRKIFEVRFVGTMSVAPGVYGPGNFHSGALIERILTIHEVP